MILLDKEKTNPKTWLIKPELVYLRVVFRTVLKVGWLNLNQNNV